MAAWKNQLFFGDNLRILREQIPDEHVDLIYLDPPFNSNATYNVLFAEKSGQKSAAQIAAFEDTWHWNTEESESAYRDVVLKGGKVSDLLSALRSFLGTNDMMAYITMMTVRLVELHRVLKPAGSIYLHCDPTASHYLKLVMDALFDIRNFRNEIIWKRTSGRKGVSQFGRVHDIILFYTKSDASVWNPQAITQTEHNVRGHDIR
jgi:site-specific DNA-methyltransferase (adenine-specific)